METTHRKPTGRPKSRWEDDVRNDMRRMQLVKWTEHVQDRPKWKVIVEKAKTVSEL
jgi:inhibitor of KinA sporulation pathway (predicted exonuclease)